MKIPIQLKVAELESRIEKLEKSQSKQIIYKSEEFTPAARKEWNLMWEHFNKFFKAIF